MAAGMRGGHAGDTPLGGDDVLGLQGVALLLARVVRFLGRIVPGSLDRLLGAVDDQRLGLLPADLRLAPHCERRLHMCLDPLDRSADHAAIDLVEETKGIG